VALTVAFSYYYRYDVIMSIVGRFNSAGEAGGGGSVFSPRHLFFYLNAIFWQIGFIGSGLFIAGFCYMLRFRNFKSVFLLSWFIVPFIVATFTQLKFIEYTMSYVLALIFIAIYFLEKIKRINLMNNLILCWVIFNMCQYFREF